MNFDAWRCHLGLSLAACIRRKLCMDLRRTDRNCRATGTLTTSLFRQEMSSRGFDAEFALVCQMLLSAIQAGLGDLVILGKQC